MCHGGIVFMHAVYTLRAACGVGAPWQGLALPCPTMSEYKPGNIVAVKATIYRYLGGTAGAHTGMFEAGISVGLARSGVECAWVHEENLATWPDAERMARLERVLLAARLDITYGTPTGTHTREMLANAVAAVNAAST
jgi:hypothetical protein